MKIIRKIQNGGGLLFSKKYNSSYERGQGLKYYSCPIGDING